jgi:tetratricopeptide (TPR) repeat protein
MNSKTKETAQKVLAIIVIVAMLVVMGIPLPVVLFFAVVTYLIWRAIQRTEQEDTGKIFEFYVAASEILRDEERRWFGFEIAEVIARGERVLAAMPDAPPLVYFTLGLLYKKAGDYTAAAEHISYVIENDYVEESRRVSPSPELRRYAQILRKLERESSEAPQTIAAIRHLERLRRQRGEVYLQECREMISTTHSLVEPAKPGTELSEPLFPPPPITEVLRDLYEEEKKTA